MYLYSAVSIFFLKVFKWYNLKRQYLKFFILDIILEKGHLKTE